MTTTALAEMSRLRDRLAAEPSGTEAALTTFPSGSAMLDVRRGGRAFVMAYTPQQGFGVDELHPDDGFTSGYRFFFADFDRAARQLHALTGTALSTDLPPPTLSLLVVQAGNVEAAKDFYSLLGLYFAEEQHGAGPRHYAATLGTLVLEIYPCQQGNGRTPLRLGFRIPSLDRTLETLRSRGARIVKEASDSPWGRRAVVEDPDGNQVELAANGVGT